MTNAGRRMEEDTDIQGYLSRLTAKLGIGSVPLSHAQTLLETLSSPSAHTHIDSHSGILPKANIRKQESFPVVERWEEMRHPPPLSLRAGSRGAEIWSVPRNSDTFGQSAMLCKCVT